ncbi:MAG: response regulator transcription factor [Bacteroidales bacterium]|jgi:DNA-binding response OmpR family regulator|nr:response regulator transcription factor [Bacteroidales bacterium]
MKLLIIEDATGIAKFLQQGLEEESFVVEIASDGKLGLEMALTNAYDLILLDWMLPGMSGIEVCSAYRQRNTTTPIIFLTAKDTLHDTLDGLKAGANDYIKKPFHFEELLERIRVQLRPKTGEHAIFRLENISLNISTHQVFKGDKEILLTQKEFALLEYLLRNKNQVCRRTRILEKVWDIHFNYSTSVIDVFINSLRKKLDGPNNESYIQTVRGIGYIIRE